MRKSSDRIDKNQSISLLCNCDVCGREIFIPVVRYWAYKRSDHHHNGDSKYFCGWNCMRKYEKEYEEECRKRRSEGQKKSLEKRKKEMVG